MEQKLSFALFAVDVESTGLDPERDRLLELSYALTRFEYPYEQMGGVSMGTYLVAGGFDHLKNANAFVQAMHEKNGLAAALDPSNERTTKTSLATIESDLLRLSDGWPLEKEERVVIAGNSPHFDLGFLRVHLPAFAARLSYRTFDASGFYRFCLSLGMPPLPKPEEAHRAAEDVRRSLELVRACGAWVLGRSR